MTLIGQLAGANTIAAEINSALSSEEFTEFKFAVAFARWSGLALIEAKLQAFASRPGNSIRAVVGVDLGGTTVEALTYLHELPSATVKILRSGNPHVVYHPKVYLFAGPEKWLSIVGSGNLSAGGLHANVEAAVLLHGNSREGNPAVTFFDELFEPKPPLTASHVQLLDNTLLDDLAKVLPAYTTSPPDRGSAYERTPNALDLSEPLPDIGRPPASTAKPVAAKKAEGVTPAVVHAPVTEATLYLELWEETGGGTQVQMPKEVFVDYFGATESTVTWIRLKTPGSTAPIPIRLQHFPNSTFRIPLSFVASTPRPAVLRFQRTAPDEYTVGVAVKGRHRRYPTWLGKCNRHTGARSKGWGIE